LKIFLFLTKIVSFLYRNDEFSLLLTKGPFMNILMTD